MVFFSSKEKLEEPLVFPHSNSLRLRTTLRKKKADGELTTAHSSVRTLPTNTLDSALESAQIESLEREIFSQLMNEAANLASASSRVSERLIVIDAVENMELRFELVRCHSVAYLGRLLTSFPAGYDRP